MGGKRSGSQQIGLQQHASQQIESEYTQQSLSAQQSDSQQSSSGRTSQQLSTKQSHQFDSRRETQQMPRTNRLQWQRQLLGALDSIPQSQPIVTQQPVSWIMTEAEIRDTLSKYSNERVLHITDMGHVVLNSHRAWDKRRSHATHDNWRFTLFAAVH